MGFDKDISISVPDFNSFSANCFTTQEIPILIFANSISISIASPRTPESKQVKIADT